MKYNHKIELEETLAAQSHDGATNMMEPESGTANRAQEACPFTLSNHCIFYGSALPAKGLKN